MHNISSESATVCFVKWDDKREPQNLSIGNVVKLKNSGCGWPTNIFISVIHWILCWPQLTNIIMQIPWCQMTPGHKLRPPYLVGYMMASSNGNIFPRYWPFVRGIQRFPMNSPHKGQWRGVLMFSLICAWTNVWANNRETGDLRRHQAHYDVSVMKVYSCLITLKRKCMHFDEIFITKFSSFEVV